MDRQLYDILYAKYIEPCSKKRESYIGVEIEMPVLDMSHIPADPQKIIAVMGSAIDAFGFKEQYRDVDGNVISAQEEKAGDIISFDCSYTNLELSFGRATTLNEVWERFKRYYSYINDELHRIGYTLTGMGIDPHQDVNSNEPVKNERYRMLYHYLHSYGIYRTDVGRWFHERPDFGTITSASQVQLDVSSDRLLDVINTLQLVEPYKAMLFANSYLPDYPQYRCVRNMLWERSMQGYEPHNVGMFDKRIDSIEELVEYIGTQAIYCVMRDGKYIDFRPVSVDKFFGLDRVEGEYFDGQGYRKIVFTPDHSDIEYLRTFKFTDLTYRGTIEYRSSCTQPIGDVMTVSAFHTGLDERIDELKEFFEADRTIYHHGYTAKELQDMFSKRPYPSFVGKGALSRQLTELLGIAERGLKNRGFGEEKFLTPLFERADKLKSPADEMIEGIESGKSISEYIEKYSQL
ncbi:MAG: glutamylcysteine synthetase [Oscillospiraceae bacterium]|nr:glutamylcysteine synthetase [Oscillospiraceae bacterium]